MTNIFTDVWDALIGKKDKKVYTQITPEQIRDNETIKNLAKKNKVLETQLSIIYAKQKEKKEKVDEIKKESDFNKGLIEQSLDLRAYKNGKIIKLGKFYKKLFEDKKFREKLEIVDKNDETVIDKFGDFVIIEGGKFGIINQDGEIKASGKSLHHILYKPDGFMNQVRRGRFTIPMDKDGNWSEDLEYVEHPEPMDVYFDENTGRLKKIKWSRIKTDQVKNIIMDKMQTISDLQEELERTEDVAIKQKLEIDDLKRTKRTLGIAVDTNQTNLSKALHETNEMNKHFRDVHSQNVKLMELKSNYESMIEQYQGIFDKIMIKLEVLSEPKYKQLKAEVMDELETYKSILPERVEIKQEAPEPKPQMVMPGEVIKR